MPERLLKIVMLLDNPFTNDGRVEREAESLASAGHQVVLFCVRQKDLPELEHKNNVRIERIFDPNLHDFWKSRLVFAHNTRILAENPDVVHCHDQLMLHLGAHLKMLRPGLVLVYDSHELYHSWPLNVSSYNSRFLFLKSWIVRRILIHREKRNAKAVDYLITVNTSIAEILTRYFKLKTPAITLRNIPVKLPFESNQHLLRSKFAISDDTKILVFIGSAIYPKTLNLEQVIDEVGDKPGLAFIIIAGEQGGKRDIMEYVRLKHYQNIYFHPKIPFASINTYLSSCDVGLVPTYNKKDLSYWLALDNKLFEYILSGIPVLAAAQPEIARVVNIFQVGVAVVPDHRNAYLDGLHEILENIDFYRKSCQLASEHLNWQNEQQVLLNFYSSLKGQYL